MKNEFLSENLTSLLHSNEEKREKNRTSELTNKRQKFSF